MSSMSSFWLDVATLTPENFLFFCAKYPHYTVSLPVTAATMAVLQSLAAATGLTLKEDGHVLLCYVPSPSVAAKLTPEAIEAKVALLKLLSSKKDEEISGAFRAVYTNKEYAFAVDPSLAPLSQNGLDAHVTLGVGADFNPQHTLPTLKKLRETVGAGNKPPGTHVVCAVPFTGNVQVCPATMPETALTTTLRATGTEFYRFPVNPLHFPREKALLLYLTAQIERETAQAKHDAAVTAGVPAKAIAAAAKAVTTATDAETAAKVAYEAATAAAPSPMGGGAAAAPPPPPAASSAPLARAPSDGGAAVGGAGGPSAFKDSVAELEAAVAAFSTMSVGRAASAPEPESASGRAASTTAVAPSTERSASAPEREPPAVRAASTTAVERSGSSAF